MALNIELGTNIKYTDESGRAYHLFEGDQVICHVGEKVYCGVISLIGMYKEKTDSESQQVICLNTSKNATSLSSEIIKVKDITYICKNLFYHNKNLLNEEQKIVNIFMEIGLSKEKAESAFNRMKEAAVYYNIPVVKAAAYAMQAIRDLNDNKMGDDKEAIKKKIAEFAKECADMAAKEYFRMLDMYLNALRQDGADILLYISDTLDIVSKCWGDLMGQNN